LIISLTEKSKVTSIIVTHEMDSAFRIGTRNGYVVPGKIIEDAEPEKFKQSTTSRRSVLERQHRSPILEEAKMQLQKNEIHDRPLVVGTVPCSSLFWCCWARPDFSPLVTYKHLRRQKKRRRHQKRAVVNAAGRKIVRSKIIFARCRAKRTSAEEAASPSLRRKQVQRRVRTR